MRSDRSDEVVVVGAGIAGLSAAHRLATAGLRVTVLEAERAPGGRMSTQAVGEGLMERGAQFLSTGYESIPGLLATLGLEDRITTVSGRTMVADDGRSWRFDTRRPLSMVAGGLLRSRDLVPAARGGWVARRELAARPTNDLGRWTDLGERDGLEWARERFGQGLTRRLVSPTVHGLYFQELDANSAALPGTLAAFSARGASAFTLSGGLGTLTGALADTLTIEYEVRVDRVQRPESPGGRVVLTTSQGRREAAAAVIAVPAGAATRILADPAPDEAAVLSTPYSRGLLAGLALAEPLAEDELGGAYGVLVTPVSSSPLAAVAVHSRTNAGPGEVLTVMFGQDAARRLATADHATVRAAAVDAVAPWLPGLADRVTDSRVTRWQEAMPYVPIGHAEAVRRYRTRLPAASPVVLAGDYLGFPWSDSAAFNGLWAADRLVAELTGAPPERSGAGP
ncbi:oxidoreductase [Actinomadura sp. NBRC 104412]|uniref:protoporphyrinogen/coproporphyrinogen oxidase n=1 Tax=Actinomadura sp. NBRC 104412 TaxID=3032203 RepID=UPI0024A452EB|nr:FAD-dependent oxidoreductase [Actinomadura sp. NBRC 104412]GLZ05689.1 oxidoreductase [Actinomadura sp. NBRC 104412]